MDELDRLGRPGAYRLGMLGASRAGPERPRAYRPSFARASRRGSLSAWVLAFSAVAAAGGGGAVVGLYFIPFLAGLVAGLVARWGGWRFRAAVTAAVAVAVVGWGIPLAWQAWRGAPGRKAAGVAGLLGLPAHGASGTIAVLLAGVLQALAGVWLGRLLEARRASRIAVQATDARTDSDETRDLVRLLSDDARRTGPQPPATRDATTTP